MKRIFIYIGSPGARISQKVLVTFSTHTAHIPLTIE